MKKQTTPESGNLVVIGHVRRAWGTKGQLIVEWLDGVSPVEIGSGTIYLQNRNGGELEKFIITADRLHGTGSVISIEGISTMTESEVFRGSEIWIEERDLPVLDENEYYSYQLIDMKVETVDGEYLGRIVEILSTGSNDVYVVKDGEKEVLIPAIADVVKEIEVEAGVVKVDLMEGLR